MAFLRWEHQPKLRRPVLVAGFEGWNDAGEAASTAVRYMGRQLDSQVIATIDPEEFYDFTVARPQVRLDEGLTRRIVWPAPTVEAAPIEAGRHDLVLMHGIEPALKWRTFCSEVLDVVRALDIELVLTLGALLAEVPHTREVSITGTAGTPEMAAELGFRRSRYEGPTGIVGVLHDACATAGIRSASLWATTPHYLREVPSPKAALALVRRTSELVGVHVPVTELEIAAAAYERQVDDMLGGDDDLVDYVHRLEDETDDEDDGFDETELPHSADALADEVERFLRDQRG